MTKPASKKLAGIIAWPVSHSLSPRLHTYWLKMHRIDGAYVPLAVSPDKLQTTLRNLSDSGYVGVNITLPHKIAAFMEVDDVDQNAQRIGAVNTVIVREDRTLFGINTDGYGFLENMRTQAPGWKADFGPAVVLGAGGAARSICVTLLDEGSPEIRLVNRTRAHAQTILDDFGGTISVHSWAEKEKVLDGATLLINATHLGMLGQERLNISLKNLSPSAVVYDIVYRPIATDLLVAAKSRGNAIIDGLGMLLFQACPAFQAWFGVTPRIDARLRNFMVKQQET